ncbi:hypothetical protein MPNT_210039 [Candidatus Methylacidithermus pantelleriae]|uniref:NodB homology domain-containing protein n=1 Tax=Candidatus Methylacidithermus pantelleriae TaxID=2744239 RepID=A0A8J2BJH6_9BACT|nr:hypothetical protein MPNT_210039 [Candidatus Methylacidithermus pantelleriae]
MAAPARNLKEKDSLPPRQGFCQKNTVSFPLFYTSLREYQYYAGETPVALMYHHLERCPVTCGPARALFVSPKRFERQLAELQKARWSVLLPGDTPQSRSLLLTFDDGYQSVFTQAFPILERYRMRAIVFLVAGHLGNRNLWDARLGYPERRLMSKEEVLGWIGAGHAIGAHTISHPDLCQLSRKQAREEICGSKKALEDRFGVPVRYFAYPYGRWNPWVVELVAEAGFEGAFTVHPGPYQPASHPLLINRLAARPRPRNVPSYWKGLRAFLGAHLRKNSPGNEPMGGGRHEIPVIR